MYAYRNHVESKHRVKIGDPIEAWIRAGEPTQAGTWLDAAEAAGATPKQLAEVRMLLQQQDATTNQPR